MRFPYVLATVVLPIERLAVATFRPVATENSTIVSFDWYVAFVDVAVELSLCAMSRGAERALERPSMALAVVTEATLAFQVLHMSVISCSYL
jgi:hypothetical protein